MQNYYAKAHTSFLGESGYNQHAKNIFTELNKLIEVKVRNFTMDGSNLFSGPDGAKSVTTENGEAVLLWHRDNTISKEQKEMLVEQSTFENGKIKNFKIKGSNFNADKTPIHIVLNESNHPYFYEKYDGIKIAYNVWESTRQPQNFFNKLLEFDQLWVPTEWQRQCSIEQGYPENKVKVVRNAVDDLPIIEKRNKNKKFTFLLIGAWGHRKATKEIIESFLEVFKGYPDVRLVVSIDSPYAETKLAEDNLKKYNLTDDRIIIKHFLNRNQYIKMIQDSDVFLSCARGEGWNLPLLESIVSGIPTICSNWGAQLEFANNVSNLVNIKGELPAGGNTPGNYCEPDFNHLKEVMLEVYNNHDKYKQIAVEKASIVKQNFSWKNSAKKAYEEMEKLTNVQEDPFRMEAEKFFTKI